MPALSFQSRAAAVTQPLSAADWFKSCGPPLRAISRSEPSSERTFFSPSLARGVGCPERGKEEELSLSDVRRTDARSAEIDRPAGVVRSFHVRLNKVEPTKSVLARNLLTKDLLRAALSDEMVPMRPKVPLVSNPASSACRAERLARRASCPHGPIVRPSGETQGVRPDADSSEEVALGVGCKFGRADVTNVPFINVAIGDHSCVDQVAEPLSGVRIDLVVICLRHRRSPIPLFAGADASSISLAFHSRTSLAIHTFARALRRARLGGNCPRSISR